MRTITNGAASHHAKPEYYALLDGDPRALVIPGEYLFRFDHFETAVMFGRAPKLVLQFTVVSMGPYFDRVRMCRFYNVTKLLERPRRWGRFKVGPMSSFVREYARLFRLPRRLDRMPMSAFANYIIVGRVRTVTVGSDQKPIPESLQYSVLDELIRIEQ